MSGCAADIEAAALSNRKLADWIDKNLEYTQLILEFHDENNPKSGWVHVSYDENNLKKEYLRADKINGKTVYTRMN